MPENKRGFQRHQSPHVLRDETRGVVYSRASRRNKSRIDEATFRANQAFATIHGLRDRGLIPPPVSVKLDPHCVGVNVLHKDLNLEKILLAVFLNDRGTESQC